MQAQGRFWGHLEAEKADKGAAYMVWGHLPAEWQGHLSLFVEG